MNRLVTSNEIESVIKKPPNKQMSRPNGFTDEVYQTFKEELMRICLKLFQKSEKEGTLPNSFYGSIPEPKTPQKRKLEANITDEY